MKLPRHTPAFALAVIACALLAGCNRQHAGRGPAAGGATRARRAEAARSNRPAPLRLRRNRRQRHRHRSRSRHRRREDRGRQTASRDPALARRQAAAGGALGFADCRPWRRRVQAAAARSRRRRHRRGRSRPRTSWCSTHHSGQDPESFDISPDGTKVYVSNEDAAEMSVLDLTSGSDHRARQSGRGARGGDPDAGRQVRLRRLRGHQRSGGRRYGRQQGRRAGEDRPAPARYRVHARRQDGVRRQRERRQHHGHRCERRTRSSRPSRFRRPPGRLPRRGRWARRSLPTASSCSIRWAGRSRSPSSTPVGRKFVRKIDDVGARPWGIALSADGRKLYTANGGSGDVSVVDVETGKVEKRITTGGSPWGVVVAVRAVALKDHVSHGAAADAPPDRAIPRRAGASPASSATRPARWSPARS